MHLLLQWAAAHRVGFRWRLALDWGSQGMRKIFKLMIPRTIGLVAGQINLISLDAFASTAGVGSVAILNIANNFQYLPIALVGISVAVAAFPTMSRDALQQDKQVFVRRLNGILKRLLWLIIPGSIIFYLLRFWILRLLLHAGNFSIQDVNLMGQVLGMFILGVWAQTLIPTLSRAFYALQNTITPVSISVVSILVNIALSVYFLRVLNWGVPGLAFAFSLAGILNAVTLWLFLRRALAKLA